MRVASWCPEPPSDTRTPQTEGNVAGKPGASAKKSRGLLEPPALVDVGSTWVVETATYGSPAYNKRDRPVEVSVGAFQRVAGTSSSNKPKCLSVLEVVNSSSYVALSEQFEKLRGGIEALNIVTLLEALRLHANTSSTREGA